MSTTEVGILNTKLDILIDDFQAHRKQSVKQEQMQRVVDSLYWHKVIGGFFITSTVGAFLMYFVR